MTPEIWKEIPGFPGYHASSMGRIKSPRKILSSANRVNNSGYEHICLWANKKESVKSVHWCVVSAFKGDQKLHVNHKNGSKRDNSIENLEWVTRGENMKHAYDTKLVKPYDRSGTKNPRSKLTEEQIREIIVLHGGGFSQIALGKRYGVSQSSIWHQLKRNSIDS